MALYGDGDIWSLMDDMASQQGYNKADHKDDHTVGQSAEDNAETSNDGEKSHSVLSAKPDVVRMINEDSLSASSKALVWNPSVRLGNEVSVSEEVRSFVPTNPQVEVLRRRAFERFKDRFRKVVDAVHANSTKTGPQNLWKDLALPSLLEKFHFDCKLQDSMGKPSASTFVSASGMEQPSFVPTTAAILQIHQSFATTAARPATTNTSSQHNRHRMEYSDPLLLSPRSKHIRTSLRKELRFEWERAWKRQMSQTSNTDTHKDTNKKTKGPKNKRPPQMSNLDQTWNSSKFQRKLARLERGVRDEASELLHGFWTDVGKTATDELTRTTTDTTVHHNQSIASGGRRKKKKRGVKVSFGDNDLVSLTYAGLTFSLHKEHYRKLQILFDRHNTGSLSLDTHRWVFGEKLFCLLTRYDTIQGAGLQSAVPGMVLDTLRKLYECRMECFASPLNCRYERFCSAFPDTDLPFGSVGSFFEYDFSGGGCYQANPPFVDGFIHRMCETMERWLSKEAQDDKENSLMFVVIVPAWKEADGWKALKDSDHLSHHVEIAQESHYYAEGTQYRRKEQYRIASFDTSVFYLQNRVAAERFPITKDGVDALLKAFATTEPVDSDDDGKGTDSSTSKRSNDNDNTMKDGDDQKDDSNGTTRPKPRKKENRKTKSLSLSKRGKEKTKKQRTKP